MVFLRNVTVNNKLVAVVYQKYLPKDVEIFIWKIEEPESFFLDGLRLSLKEKAQIARLKGKRKLEWLASRYLLHRMSGRAVRGACIKDEFGKPHLENSDYHISFSHSADLVTVIASPFVVGIDIQRFVGKISRIAHKFMSEKETKSLTTGSELAHLHVYWGAKEAIYKGYGRKELDFRQNIVIDAFPFDKEGGKFSGQLLKGALIQDFDLGYEFFDDFTLVYAVEK